MRGGSSGCSPREHAFVEIIAYDGAICNSEMSVDPSKPLIFLLPRLLSRSPGSMVTPIAHRGSKHLRQASWFHINLPPRTPKQCYHVDSSRQNTDATFCMSRCTRPRSCEEIPYRPLPVSRSQPGCDAVSVASW